MGFTAASATIGQFILRDLWLDRKKLSAEVEEKFGALDARIKNLEQFNQSNPDLKLQPDGSNLKWK